MTVNKNMASNTKCGFQDVIPTCILQLAAVQAVLQCYPYTKEQVVPVAKRMLHNRRPARLKTTSPEDHICDTANINAESLAKELESVYRSDLASGERTTGASMYAQEASLTSPTDFPGGAEVSSPGLAEGAWGTFAGGGCGGDESAMEEALEADSCPGGGPYPDSVHESAHSDVSASAAQATPASCGTAAISRHLSQASSKKNVHSSHEAESTFLTPSLEGEASHQRCASSSSSSSLGHSDSLKREASTSLSYNDSASEKVLDEQECRQELSKKLRSKIAVLRRENEKLKARQLCRHCKGRPTNLTFLPCGHFCFCVECGSTFDQCPVCRKTILADVRTFVS